MTVSRFGAMVGALVWRQPDGKYLLLQRAAQRISPQGNGSASQDGTTHFYRGAAGPEQEMVGVHYGCSAAEGRDIRLSQEHSACQWVTVQEAEGLFPAGHWLRELVGRTEVMRGLLKNSVSSIGRTAARYSLRS
jgi:hypothetical protein